MPSMTGWPTISKITVGHRDRLAVVYIRQSTRQQVLEHQESTRLQYALADRAVELGWPPSRVMIIDDDLGRSGVGVVDRAGFQRLVTEITLGHVGLVLGIEMSRLARSGRDWYQLLELCSVAGVLLADTDGVYDPGEYNDRLVLGLKGTMSEAELHLIKQRMYAGKVAKARRGELAMTLPAGYWRRPSGQVVLDPDEQVRTVVRLVFAKFTELGSVQGVMRWLVENGIEIGSRARTGPRRGEVVWRCPARATITCMLHNPVYAGIYAYGRRRVDPTRKRPGHPAAGIRRHEPDDWLARIEGALPAYITVEQYQANQARLAANAPHGDTPGAARYGPALLAGLLRCGRCHRRMTVSYHVDDGKPRISYDCTGAAAEFGGPACQHVSGRCLDQAVTQAVLAALAPAGTQVCLRAVEQARTDRTALEKVWTQRLERARIDVERAERCYRLVDPANRLVARTLEQDWEQALAAQHATIEDHERFQATRPHPLSAQQIQALHQLAGNLSRLWHTATTTTADHKEILRAVIDEITVTVRGHSELLDVVITWAGGHTTPLLVTRPIQRFEHLSYYPDMVARILHLADQGLDPVAIAAQLTRDGIQPARGPGPIRFGIVTQILMRAGRPVPHRRQPIAPHPDQAPGPDEWWLADLAAHLGITTGTLRGWQKHGLVAGRQETYHPHRWIITADPTKIAELRDHLTRVRGRTTKVHPRFTRPADFPPVHSA